MLSSSPRREFLGAFYATASEYWVCAQRHDADNPNALGLEAATLPGGVYLRARLQGQPPTIYEHIPSALTDMKAQAQADDRRPIIEFYQATGTIDLFLPIP